MGLLRRLIGSTPKEELKGIRLDLTQPFWELDGETDFPSLLSALIGFLPGGCTLYFEGGFSEGELVQFMKARQIQERIHVAVGTLWPRPKYYHIPATSENLSELAEIAEHHAEPELAVHFHVYCEQKIILEWHDAFAQPMLLAGTLGEGKVKVLANELNMEVTKWKNAREQVVAPDRQEKAHASR